MTEVQGWVPIDSVIPRQPTVGEVMAAGATLQTALERCVTRLRAHGASWNAVARATGTTKQAAHKKWRYVDDLIGPVVCQLRVDPVTGERTAGFWFTGLGEFALDERAIAAQLGMPAESVDLVSVLVGATRRMVEARS